MQKKWIVWELIFFFIIFFSPSTKADPRLEKFTAPLEDSKWEFNSSKESCELTHTIPGYGTAYFKRFAGFPTQMEITAFERPPVNDPEGIRLVMQRPSWHRNQKSFFVQKLALKRGDIVVQTGSALTETILKELKAGWQPTFYHKNWLSGKGKVAVALSPINFKTAYSNFQQCLHDIPNYSFNEKYFSTVYFDNNSAELDIVSQDSLNELIRYINKVDVGRIRLAGFSDNVGRTVYNKRLAKQRAEAVEHYLLEHGLPKEKMSVLVIGNKKFTAKNNTAKGRAKNRRVTITLER